MGFQAPSGICFARYHAAPGEDTYAVPPQYRVIGKYAFSRSNTLREVYLPQKLARIELCAFQQCTGLRTVSLPETLQFIGERAFAGCSALTEVRVPDSCAQIENGAFECCKGLKSASIGRGTMTLGKWAFRGCSGLQEVSMTDRTLLIGEEAFDGCDALEHLYLHREDGRVFDVARSAKYRCFADVVRVISGYPSRVIPNRLEVYWQAYAWCGDEVLRPEITGRATDHLRRFLEDARFADIERMMEDDMIRPAVFDRELAEYWSPDKPGKPWVFYIHKLRSVRAVSLLQRHCTETLTPIVAGNHTGVLQSLIDHKCVHKKNVDVLLETAIDAEAHDAQMMLLHVKEQNGLYTDPRKALLL